MRAGTDRDVGAGQQVGEGVPVGEVAGEGDGQPARLAAQLRLHRAAAGDHEPRVDTVGHEGAHHLDAPRRVLLHRQPAGLHEEDLGSGITRPARPAPGAGGPPGARLRRGAGGPEGVEVDSERHRLDVGRLDAGELLAGERGGADDRVVAAGRAEVRDVGRPLRRAGDAEGDHAVEALVADHDRADAARLGPRPHAAQGEAVGDLETVGAERRKQAADADGTRGPVALHAEELPAGHRDPADARIEDLVARRPAGDDEGDRVAARHVSGAQLVDRGAQPARAGAVEVRELDDVHPARLPAGRSGR
ncbi:hypothetical protein MTP03_39820 [Tsukamurella sp. PLM1]|nr:hypothetical protein MTP03_39820 [Tsukamurella sp. PLM1]